MKREILFRGKTINTGEWVESITISNGTIKMKKNLVYIKIEEGKWAGVIPESVGQFIGLTDKKGVKIFEGDIVKTETDKNMVVSWSKKFASFCIDREGWAFVHWFGEACDPEQVEVIGNITDNPEMIKKE